MSAPVAAAPKPKKAAVAKKPAEHPKYAEMIVSAIKALKERNGSSRQAIQKYIQANFKVGDNVSVHLKLALKRGVVSKLLKQVKGTGASGSFKIGEAPKPAVKKPAKKPAVKKVAKKAAKKSPTKAKKSSKKAATPKKPVAKKSAAKKPATKKPVAKKSAAKKPAAKKPAKAAAKGKKPAAKKSTKKTPTKKA